MACNSCPHGDLCRFVIPYLANHYNIRVLPQNGTKAACKGETRLDVDLHLVYARHTEFNRILHRYDVHARFVQVAENGVKSGRFSASGRPRNQDYAVWGFQYICKKTTVVFGKTEILDGEQCAGTTENTYDHFFTGYGGEHREAQVDRLPVEHNLDPAVLRDALFGYIHIAHNFEPCDD